MTNLASILTKIYHEIPDHTAITMMTRDNGDHPISYRQLYLGAANCAHALKEANINPGEIVIIIQPHCEMLIYSFWGCILHGTIPSIMPFLTEKLSPEHYRKSLESLFKITKPTSLITYREFVNDILKDTEIGDSVRKIIISEEIELNSDCATYYPSGLDRQPCDIAFLQHSSGTTGLQKGVALSHESVINQLESYSKAINLNSSDTDSDIIVSWLPLYHDMGLIAGFIMPVLMRTQLILMSPFDWVKAPYRLIQAISKYKGTLCWLPNFAYNFCAQKIRDRDLETVDLSSWRAVINCSEPMYWQSHLMFLERFKPFGFRETALATCYAMAENVFAVTQAGIDTPVHIDMVDRYQLASQRYAKQITNENQAVRMVSAGRPIPNTEIMVVNAEGISLPERMVGEICLKSDCMLTGYLNRPEINEKSFLNGWYLTGDLGYVANGELYISGRKKDLIIVGGKNIYPQDLEMIASGVPGVHPGRVAAFGIYDPHVGTEEVVIISELDNIDTIKTEYVFKEIQKRINQSSDISVRIVKLVHPGWLLKTSSGKVSRSANKEKYLSEFTNNV